VLDAPPGWSDESFFRIVPLFQFWFSYISSSHLKKRDGYKNSYSAE
jgi:hypothetical protein